MAVMGGEPSSAQHATPDREEDPQLSPGDSHPGGRTPCQLQANLGNLSDDEQW